MSLFFLEYPAHDPISPITNVPEEASPETLESHEGNPPKTEEGSEEGSLLLDRRTRNFLFVMVFGILQLLYFVILELEQTFNSSPRFSPFFCCCNSTFSLWNN